MASYAVESILERGVLVRVVLRVVFWPAHVDRYLEVVCKPALTLRLCEVGPRRPDR